MALPRRQMAGGSAVGDSRAAARPVGATNDRDGAATACAAALGRRRRRRRDVRRTAGDSDSHGVCLFERFREADGS